MIEKPLKRMKLETKKMINEYEGLTRLFLMGEEKRFELHEEIQETAFKLADLLNDQKVSVSVGISAMFSVMLQMQKHGKFKGENLRMIFDRMWNASEEIDKSKKENL